MVGDVCGRGRMHGRGVGMHGRGRAWQGACMAVACMMGGMHGRGACMAGGMCGGGMHGGRHVWWGACMGVCMAGGVLDRDVLDRGRAWEAGVSCVLRMPPRHYEIRSVLVFSLFKRAIFYSVKFFKLYCELSALNKTRLSALFVYI